MRLKSFLSKQNLSHADLAKKLGCVTGQAVRNWSLGLRMPEPLLVERIVEVTNRQVTVQDLHDERVEFLKSQSF